MIIVWRRPIVTTVETVLHELKHRTGLLNEIKDVGTDFMVTCPMHSNGQERKASCGVSKQEVKRYNKTYEAGTVHCYSCGYTASLPQLVSDMLNLGNEFEGFKWLNKHYNFGSASERSFSLDLDRATTTQQKVEVETVLVTRYQQELHTSKKAQDYLQKRKIDMRTAEYFGIGYNKEHDSIVFPVQDLDGQVRMLKERSIETKQFYNTKGVDKSSLIYGLHQVYMSDITNAEKIWICESEIDALTVWTYGGMAIAIMGSHISEQQMKALHASGIRKLVDGLDRDKAGRKGWQHIKDQLIPKGYRTWNTVWNNNCKDINELTKSQFESITLI